ncbi:MAG: c-type cytochrome, partial [Spirochaetota bacterium]|nr:c-type cytochrome [Spirochaetota bacterium]
MSNKVKITTKVAGVFMMLLAMGWLFQQCGDKPKGQGDTSAGKQVYMSKGCAGCHSFGGGDKPNGPDLKGVTSKRSKDWLKTWLKDPGAMAKSDDTAKALVKQYKGFVMPKVDLSDKDIDNLISYMAAQSSGTAGSGVAFKPLSASEFEEGKKTYFNLCSGCHGAKRWGATGPSLLPKSHIVKAKEVSGGGTLSKGTEALEGILFNGTPGGMPAWGKEGIMTKSQINIIARYIQMDPPAIPSLDLAEAKKRWKLIVPVNKRPKKDLTGGKFENYFGVVLRDAGKVAIIDGTSKKMLAVIDTGKAVHILRSSHSGRYFFAIGRDGKASLIDLWSKKPTLVAQGRTCWDARSVDTSKGPGYHDKYAIVGCYTPNQYAIMDGET